MGQDAFPKSCSPRLCCSISVHTTWPPPQHPYLPFNYCLILELPLCCLPHLIRRELDFVHEHVSSTWHRAWHSVGTQEMCAAMAKGFLMAVFPSYHLKGKGNTSMPRQRVVTFSLAVCIESRCTYLVEYQPGYYIILSYCVCYLGSYCLTLADQQP